MEHFVYILFNHSRTLYVGMTDDLPRRLDEHRRKLIPGFTKKYNINQLACYEVCPDAMSAMVREKQLKGWTRANKIALIESMNPLWEDLSVGLHILPRKPLPKTAQVVAVMKEVLANRNQPENRG